MANETLKAFYYGNLAPSEQQMVHGSRTSRIMKELSDAEHQLDQSLPEELLPVLNLLIRAQQELDSIVAEANYIDGFKTGARFMLEILDDASGDLKPVTE